MSINAIPDGTFYDPQSWLDLAPDYDWSELTGTEGLTIEQPESGVLRISGPGVRSLGGGVLEVSSDDASAENGVVALGPKG